MPSVMDLIDEDIDDAEPEEQVETDEPEKAAEEGASREDDTPDDAKAEKELAEQGPEWAKKRLSVVTAKRREAEEQKSKLEAELAAARKELAAVKKAASKASIFDDDEPEDEPTEADELRKRLAAMEAKEKERELDRVVSQAKKAHPDVPEFVVLAAIANNFDVDDAATTFEAMLEERVATRLAEAKKGADSKPAAKPLNVAGKSSGGAGAAKPKPKPERSRKPVNMRDLMRSITDSIMDEDD